MTRRAEAGVVVAGFSLLAIAMTYPVAAGLRTRIASDLGDPLLVAWMLAWDADRLRHGLAGIWDAPNFFPYRHTLLYSEHFLGVAIFTAPMQWLTGNAVLVYNLAFLGSFVLTAIGMYVLARLITKRTDAAWIAAAIYACYPFRASHVSHLQVLAVGWLPLGMWALHRYFDSGKLRHLLACTLFFVLQALTNGYFAYFSLLPLGMAAAYELWRRRAVEPRLVAHAAIAAVCAAAVMLPVVRGYSDLRRESGQRRPFEEIASQSADVADYLSASPSLHVWKGIGNGRGEHELFPGAIALALALLSIKYRPRRGAIALYAAILAAALVLSLGPLPRVFGRPLGVPGPYALLLRVVPGLDGLRVIARLAIVAQMAIAMLAAFGAAWLADRLSPRVPRAALAGALVLLIAVEGWSSIGSAAFDYRGDPRDREAYAYLESLPRGAAIELPTRAEDVLPEFVYQYMTIVHGHRVVNGHSGYVTPLAVWLRGGHSPLRETGRQNDAVAMLRAIGVRYLVVHRGAYADAALRDELLRVIETDPQVLAHRSFADATVAVLTPFGALRPPEPGSAIPSASIVAHASDGADRLSSLFDGDSDSRWLTGHSQSGDEWLALDFDRPRDVASVRLQLGERSFGDYPRELVVESVDEGGSRELFRGSVLPQFALGLIASGDYPFIDVALPPNATRTLRLRQRGTAHTFFWSIHELQVNERLR